MEYNVGGVPNVAGRSRRGRTAAGLYTHTPAGLTRHGPVSVSIPNAKLRLKKMSRPTDT
jgi:hypothetical protein